MLKLSGQDHVHEDHGQAESDEEILKRFLHRLGTPGEYHPVIRGEVEFLHHLANIPHRITQGVIGQVGDDRNFALSLKTVDLVRPSCLLK